MKLNSNNKRNGNWIKASYRKVLKKQRILALTFMLLNIGLTVYELIQPII